MTQRHTAGATVVVASLVALVALSGCAIAPTPSAPLATLRVAPLDRTGSDGSFTGLSVSATATPQVPTTLPVYRVVHGRSSTAQAQAQAQKLGIRGTQRVDGSRVRITGARASFAVDTDTGSFDYTTLAFEQQDSPLRSLLSDEEYRKRAEAFLADKGLMEPTARFRDVNRDNTVSRYVDGQWVATPYMVEVRFDHEPLAGVPFDQGVGPRLIVQFGEAGRIIGATSVWREVEPAGEYPVVAPADAVAQVTQGNAQVFDAAKSSTGVATTMSLSYINDPAGYAQEFVVPHYVIRGTTSTAGARRFTAITRGVPARYLEEDPSIARGDTPAWPPTGQRRE